MASFTPEQAAAFIEEAKVKSKALMGKLGSDIVKISSPGLSQSQINQKLQSSAKKQICGIVVASGENKDKIAVQYDNSKKITVPFTTQNRADAISFNVETDADNYKADISSSSDKYIYSDLSESEVNTVSEGKFYLKIASGELANYYIKEKTNNPLLTTVIEDVSTWFESESEAQQFINNLPDPYIYEDETTSEYKTYLVFSPSTDVDNAVADMAGELAPDMKAKNDQCWGSHHPRKPTQQEMVGVIKSVIGKYA